MKNFKGFNTLNVLLVGSIAGALSFIVGWIINYFKIPTAFYQYKDWFSITASVVDIDLRNQVIQNGSFQKLGLKIIDFLQSKLSFDFVALIAVVVGTAAVFLIGRLLYALLIKKDTGGYKKTRVILSFLLGAFVFAVMAAFMFGIPFNLSVVSLLVYALCLGIIMQLMVNSDKIKLSDD